MPAIAEQLIEMERELVAGRKLMRKQMTILDKLGWGSHDTTEAKRLLLTLIEAQELRMRRRVSL